MDFDEISLFIIFFRKNSTLFNHLAKTQTPKVLAFLKSLSFSLFIYLFSSLTNT